MYLKLIAAWVLIASVGTCACAEGDKADETTDKQPVFVLCPHNEHYGSWSLYVTVDKSDPSKLKNFGVEELVDKNSKDNGYQKVLEAQRDPKSARAKVAELDAKSLGSTALRVERDDALRITLTPEGDDYRVAISLRTTLSGRFEIGGTDARKLLLTYNKAVRSWEVVAKSLADVKGRNVVNGAPLLMTGLAFKVTTTGIYRIVAAPIAGAPVLVMDN